MAQHLSPEIDLPRGGCAGGVRGSRRSRATQRLAPLGRVLMAQGLSSATSFATLLALGRWAGEGELGRFALGWSCWFLAMSLGDTLIATPYTYFRAQPRPPVGDLGMAAALATLLLAAAFALGLSLLQPFDALGLATLWPALPAAVAAASVREFRRRQLLSAGDGPALLRLDAAGAALQLAGVCLLAAGGLLGAAPVFWVITLAAGLPLLPLLTPARLRRLRQARSEVTAALRAFFAYGRWLLMGGLCHVLSVQALPWLAFASGGTRLAGLLAACNAVLNLLSPLLTGLSNHFRPRFMVAFVQRPGSGFTPFVLWRLPAFVLPALLLWLLLHLAGALVLTRLYGPAFAEGAPALSWLALGTVAVALAAPLQLGLLARGAPMSNLLYHGCTLLALGLGLRMLGLGDLDITALGRLYGGANLFATAVLALMFFSAWPRAAASR